MPASLSFKFGKKKKNSHFLKNALSALNFFLFSSGTLITHGVELLILTNTCGCDPLEKTNRTQQPQADTAGQHVKAALVTPASNIGLPIQALIVLF